MNKQELIYELKRLLANPSEIKGSDYAYGHNYGIGRAITLAKQLGEPEKQKVPQFVADWYEEHKDNFDYSVQCLCVQGRKPVRQIDVWFDNDDNKPIVTLVKMKLFGYEVEKEKLYTVEIPNPNIIGAERTVLMKNGFNQIVMLRVYDHSDNWRTVNGYQLTETEIRKDFEWAWQWAKEVE